MFYNTNLFSPLKIFEENYFHIKEELMSIIGKPMVELYKTTWMQERPDLVNQEGNGWRTFTFRFFGINHIPNMQECPLTSELIMRFPSIVTAEFSLLAAGTHILPHKGYSNNVLRAHVGLVIPEGNVKLRVEDEVRSWEEGKILIFDDSKEHEAWNFTNEDRAVFMFDFEPAFNNDKARTISKEVLHTTNDKFIHSISSRDKWLEWFEKGCFPYDLNTYQ